MLWEEFVSFWRWLFVGDTRVDNRPMLVLSAPRKLGRYTVRCWRGQWRLWGPSGAMMLSDPAPAPVYAALRDALAAQTKLQRRPGRHAAEASE